MVQYDGYKFTSACMPPPPPKNSMQMQSHFRALIKCIFSVITSDCSMYFLKKQNRLLRFVWINEPKFIVLMLFTDARINSKELIDFNFLLEERYKRKRICRCYIVCKIIIKKNYYKFMYISKFYDLLLLLYILCYLVWFCNC